MEIETAPILCLERLPQQTFGLRALELAALRELQGGRTQVSERGRVAGGRGVPRERGQRLELLPGLGVPSCLDVEDAEPLQHPAPQPGRAVGADEGLGVPEMTLGGPDVVEHRRRSGAVDQRERLHVSQT
jgi:hypothetical protein